MSDRWVCKRCFADNEEIDGSCARCGLARGAEATIDDQRAWAAQTGRTFEEQPPAWRRWLRFWWIPAIGVFLVVGYLTAARRDDAGSLTSAGTVSVYELRVGDCFNTDAEGELSDVSGVPCEEPHAYEVFAVADYEGSAYPASDAAYAAAFYDVCAGPFASYVGEAFETSELWASAITPTEAGWRDGDREFVCYLYEEDESDMTASMAGAER